MALRAASPEVPTVAHGGQRADLILERAGGATTGVRRQAGRDDQRADAPGLVTLRDSFGETFTAVSPRLRGPAMPSAAPTRRFGTWC